MNPRRVILAALFLSILFVPARAATSVAAHFVFAQQTQTTSPAPVAPTQAAASQNPPEPQKITKYTLRPDRYEKAHNLGKIRFRFALINFVYGLVVLWLILRWKFASRYRTWAENKSSRRILQALIFSPLLILTIDVFELSTGIYQQWVSRQYGLSIQRWGSWFWDWTKGELISVVIATILVWILYAVIHKSARGWWFYFWLASMPIGLLLFFLQPLIIQPLFNKFEPLAQKNPALTVSLEKLVQRAGERIPPERMFLMIASEKTTAVDAYVTGFGASKRIVVYDTTIAKATAPEILFVAGHELGHYALGHIPKGLAFFAALLFLFFYLGFRSIGWVLARWSAGWDVRGVGDWASLPVLMLILSVLFFVANPVSSAFSRHYEHQADQYGLEAIHDLVPDSGQAAAQGFLLGGDIDLGDPEPNAVDVFLFYDHPPVSDRVQFAVTYDPWSHGQQGEFVK